MSTHAERAARRAIQRGERPRLEVTREEDEGITVRDHLSNVVLSIISTHPGANGPKGLIVEAYAYDMRRRQVMAQDTPAELLRNPRTLVRTYMTYEREDPEGEVGQ